MKKIYKYPLNFHFSEKTSIGLAGLPAGAKILTVQLQNGIPHIWALVDPDKHPLEIWSFIIFGTGEEIPEDWSQENYIGTYQKLGGALIWHVFGRKIK